MLKLYENVLNRYYDSACWEMLNQFPDAMWCDLSNVWDGCAFE